MKAAPPYCVASNKKFFYSQFICFILFVLCCHCQAQQQSFEDELTTLKIEYSYIPENFWVLVNYSDCPWETTYMLQREYNDTSYYMSMIKMKPSFKYEIDSTEMGLAYFRKNFPDSDFTYHLEMVKDTNYFYKTPVNNQDSLIFIVGKYYYQWRHGLMNSKGMHYFLNNFDSLKAVRGNDLPALHLF